MLNQQITRHSSGEWIHAMSQAEDRTSKKSGIRGEAVPIPVQSLLGDWED